MTIKISELYSASQIASISADTHFEAEEGGNSYGCDAQQIADWVAGQITAGDVTGAASSTDNAIPRFDGVTGKVLQGSGVIVADDNAVTGVKSITLTTPLAVGSGGSGAASFSGILKGNGASAFSAATAGADYVHKDTKTAFTKQQNFAAVSLTDAANITWDLDDAQSAKVTLEGNRTFNAPSQLVDGGTYILTIIQDATGGRTATWNSVFKWAGGSAPTLSTGANAIDVLTFVSDGTNMYGAAQLGFS